MMKLSELITLINEELDKLDISGEAKVGKDLAVSEKGEQDDIGDDDLSKKDRSMAPRYQEVEDELEDKRPDYSGGKVAIEKMQDSHAEENEEEDNLPPSEDEPTEDRKTVVLMTKFGHIPAYKAIIDAENKEDIITALNKLTKERGFNAATYFLNYYKRLGQDKDTASLHKKQ